MNCRFLSSRVNNALSKVFRLTRDDSAGVQYKLTPLTASNRAALAHFDRYYGQAYGSAVWSAIRIALLTPPTKAGLINHFCPPLEGDPASLYATGTLDLIEVLKESQSRLAATLIDQPASPSPPKLDSSQTQLETKPPSRRQFLGRESSLTSRSGSSLDLSEFISTTELITDHEMYTRASDDDVTFGVDVSSLSVGGESLPAVRQPLDLPEHLRLRCLRPGQLASFGKPRRVDDRLDFYPLDLASVLPVLALNLQPGDSLLDLCAAPGGKSLLALQTRLLSRLVCVDKSPSRLDRLQQVLKSCGPSTTDESYRPSIGVVEEHHLGQFLETSVAGEEGNSGDGLFAKVLVDAPCSTDRHALNSDEGSLFSPGKQKARVGLLGTQELLLRRGMMLCRPGGTVVYSTCTLSPGQNQHIVETCLKEQRQDKEDSAAAQFVPLDLTPLMQVMLAAQGQLGLQIFPVLGSQRSPDNSGGHGDVSVPLGLLVVPTISANYGPAFIAALRRTA